MFCYCNNTKTRMVSFKLKNEGFILIEFYITKMRVLH
jgi:hypothetical protein